MKINSPQAESVRASRRRFAEGVIIDATPAVPRWQAEGDALMFYKLIAEAQLSMKRELQYLRILKQLGKPRQEKKCELCRKRKNYAEASKPFSPKSKATPTNREECLKIMASIEECWPGWRKVPELLWNQYIDAAGKCRCGRTIAPKIVSRSPKPQHCCLEHKKKWEIKQFREKKRAFAKAKKTLSEEME